MGNLDYIGHPKVPAGTDQAEQIVEGLHQVFPENLISDGKKCRTPGINEVLRLILLIDNEKQKVKSGQIYEFLDLSAQVTPPGFEPRS